MFAEIKMDAACVSVCLAIFKLMCNWSLNNEVILLSILSGIVILIFPPPPVQNCDVCCISMVFKKKKKKKKRMKCDMAVQTEVALQNIGYVSDLGPHMKVAWA